MPKLAWPRGPMDKASAYGAGDCRFESYRGQLCQAGVAGASVLLLERASARETRNMRDLASPFPWRCEFEFAVRARVADLAY